MSDSRRTRGGCFYVSIMHAIERAKEPPTDTELHAQLGGVRRSMADTTKRMEAAGLIRAVAWSRSGSHFVPRWGFGAEVPHPAGKCLKWRTAGVEMIAFAALWRELELPSSTAELMEDSGYGRVTIGIIIRHAKRLRMVRVAAWHQSPTGSALVPLFMRGASFSAPRPPPKTQAAAQRKYITKLRMRDLHARIAGSWASACAGD